MVDSFNKICYKYRNNSLNKVENGMERMRLHRLREDSSLYICTFVPFKFCAKHKKVPRMIKFKILKSYIFHEKH